MGVLNPDFLCSGTLGQVARGGGERGTAPVNGTLVSEYGSGISDAGRVWEKASCESNFWRLLRHCS